jgi:adenylate cyclase
MIRNRRRAAVVVVTLLFVVAGAAWGAFLGIWQVAALGSPLDRLENVSLDWRYALAGVHMVPHGVVIVAIDDDTIAQAGSFPLPRAALARIIRSVAARNPQVIAIDILLIDPGPEEADLELVQALRAAKTVIGAAGLFEADNAPHYENFLLRSGTGDFLPHPMQILWPQKKFSDVARPALTNVSTDHSGVPRYVPLLFASDGALVPSFVLSAAAAALNAAPVLGNHSLRLGARPVATDQGYHLPLRFYGPRGSIRTISASRALTGELDPEDVRGQAVMIGVTATGTGDGFATPFDRVTPGVEVLATAVSNVLTGDALIRDGFVRLVDASFAVGLPIVIVLLLAIPRISVALGLIMLTFGGWLVLNWFAFRQGYWLSIALPAAASIPVAVACGLMRLWVEQRISRRLASDGAVLRRFQPPRLVDVLIRDPQFLTTPVHQDAAIVFVDLSGFTFVAESLGPTWTRELLAALHERIETTVASEQGFVLSYMGDGAMMMFGLPSPSPDDADRALRAVRSLHSSLSTWLAVLPPVARERLTSRIGAHFGPVILSRLGAAVHQHIAATGDTVNVASRLVEVAKGLKARIVVSEDLFRAAGRLPGSEERNGIGHPIDVSIRGRVHPILIRIWEGNSDSAAPLNSDRG